MTEGRYVVTSEGVYLRNLRLAVLGRGLDGGAFTKDPKKAIKYSRRRDAERDAASVYQGEVRDLKEAR